MVFLIKISLLRAVLGSSQNSKEDKEISHTPPHTVHGASPVVTTPTSGALLAIEPIGTRHCHSKFIAYIRVHSW